MRQKRCFAHSEVYEYYGKPYHFFGDYLRDTYGVRIFKLPVNAALGCPNRESGSPCIFCSDTGSASPSTGNSHDIHTQMKNARDSFVRTNIKTEYIAYFQAYTNTYAHIGLLKELYDAAASFPGVRGLMIGTRPDCLTEEVAALISSYDQDNFELWVEIGMQSVHDRSLSLLSRHHTHEDTEKALALLERYGIRCCVHLIIGIPGETREEMMVTANTIAHLPVDGVKFHHLHILKGTLLAAMHEKKPLPLLTLSDYASIFCDFCERLPGSMLIHRLAGDALEDEIIAPRWGLEKGTVQKTIETEFRRRGSWQGFLYQG
ncbi:MAG: TIGR01212 family radical SAM protein [Spirochaetota bacterium]